MRVPRPTRYEAMAAVALTGLSLLEVLGSDEQPEPTPLRLATQLVPCVVVAYTRTAPRVCAVVLSCVLLLQSVVPSESGTLGAGFAWMATVFGLVAWRSRPWGWLALLVVAGSLRDLRTLGDDGTNMVVDWLFVVFVVAIARLVHSRATREERLSAQLALEDQERARRTAEAVARERAVIARELHDIVAHSVSLMVVQAAGARPAAERQDPEIAHVLGTIEHAGREALTELRRLLGVLRADDEATTAPVPDLDRVDDLIADVQRAGVDVHTTLEIPADVPPGIALCAYRAIQEGLTNALRHAPGARVDVTVLQAGPDLLVTIEDAGPGAGDGDVARMELGTGTGLSGLRERVLLCRGRMEAGARGRGFRLRVTLPLREDVPVRTDGAAFARGGGG